MIGLIANYDTQNRNCKDRSILDYFSLFCGFSQNGYMGSDIFEVIIRNDEFNSKNYQVPTCTITVHFKTYLNMKIYCNVGLSYSCCIMRFGLCKQPFLIESKHLLRFELNMKENIDIIFMIVKLHGNR